MEGDYAKGSTAPFPHTRPQCTSQAQTLRSPHCPGLQPLSLSLRLSSTFQSGPLALSTLAGSIHSHSSAPLNSLLPAGLTAAFLREDSSSQGARERRNKEKEERA